LFSFAVYASGEPFSPQGKGYSPYTRGILDSCASTELVAGGNGGAEHEYTLVCRSFAQSPRRASLSYSSIQKAAIPQVPLKRRRRLLQEK